MNTKPLLLAIAVLAALNLNLDAQTDSLPALRDGKSPQSVDDVWAGYDPAVEPIESEIVKEWQEGDTVLRAVRYCIGTFKSQKSWMGALYVLPNLGVADPKQILQCRQAVAR